MNKVICICGMPGSGKSLLSDYFVKKGFNYVRFGQVVLDEIIKNKIEPSEINQKQIREKFRRDLGMDAIAQLNLPVINKLLKTGNVVADGLYSWSEYKYLKGKLADKMILIAVYSPPYMRYERLSKRHPDAKDIKLRNHHFSHSEAKARDYNEIENIEKGGPIAMADFTVLNTKNLPFLYKQLNVVYKQIYDN